jgi:hypothetical protein
VEGVLIAARRCGCIIGGLDAESREQLYMGTVARSAFLIRLHAGTFICRPVMQQVRGDGAKGGVV